MCSKIKHIQKRTSKEHNKDIPFFFADWVFQRMTTLCCDNMLMTIERRKMSTW